MQAFYAHDIAKLDVPKSGDFLPIDKSRIYGKLVIMAVRTREQNTRR
jgi:hypothetical protein